MAQRDEEHIFLNYRKYDGTIPKNCYIMFNMRIHRLEVALMIAINIIIFLFVHNNLFMRHNVEV